jgi:hypothetical protein
MNGRWSMGVALLALPLLAGVDLRPRMQAHWKLASSVQTEIISGNLEVAQQMAVRLADLPVAELPEEMSAALTELRVAATDISLAPDLASAARATAHLGGTCARCHAQSKRGPSTHARSLPPEDWSPGLRMNQHQWGADWLWLGFVAPSQPAWDRGARELARAALPDAEHLDEPALKEMLRELATEAVGMTDREAQESLMGELLQVCAECHMGS